MTIEKTAKSGIELAAHVLMATIVLVVVALAAVGLGYFHHWLASLPVDIIPPAIPKTLQYMEYGVFALDITTYCLYVGVMSFSFMKSLKP